MNGVHGPEKASRVAVWRPARLLERFLHPGRSILVALCLASSGLATPLAALGAGDEPLDFSKAPPDVLPWGLLAKVGVRYDGDRVVPQFLPPVLALDGTRVSLYGYMTPVDSGRRQRRFLLSWRPIFCAGCERPIGPEGIVEVNLKRPIAPKTEAFSVRGTLRVLQADPLNVLYRLIGASVVPEPVQRKEASASRKPYRQRHGDDLQGPSP